VRKTTTLIIILLAFVAASAVLGVYLLKFQKSYHQESAVNTQAEDQEKKELTKEEKKEQGELIPKDETKVEQEPTKTQEQKLNLQTKQAGEEKEGYTRKNISFLKMVSSENGMYLPTEEEISRLKDLNINSVRLCLQYQILPNGDVSLTVPEAYYLFLIKKFHEAGLAVFLEVNPFMPGTPSISDSKYIDIFYKIASKWAKVAEQEKIEFFSPLNEPNLIFSNNSLVKAWINKSQELRPLFSGNLVLKLADVGSEEIKNIGKYDYLAFDIMWNEPYYNDLRNRLKLAINRANKIKSQYGLKGFFFGELGAEIKTAGEDVQAEIFRVILEETWGKVDGYCFLGWSNLEYSFKGKKGEEVIKEWFSRD